jgi:hypothetical protein
MHIIDLFRELVFDRPAFREDLNENWKALVDKCSNKGTVRLTRRDKEAILYQQKRLDHYNTFIDLWLEYQIESVKQRVENSIRE